MEPPHSYLRAPSASVVHHADYLGDRDDQALCGQSVQDATAIPQTGDTDAICPDCAAKLVVYHLQWWRGRAEAVTAELEELRVKYRELQADAPDSVELEAEGVPSGAERAEPEPTTLLDRARRELTELCRQFDGDVPYFRLKTTMQAFSDTLATDERVLLAQEIGGDGTLIRWSTIEVETLGFHVANSPLQGTEANWDAWVQESYPTPKKGKRRFGRTR